MKKIIYILSIFFAMTFSVGCNDFLEMPPAANFYLDSVFTKYDNAEKLLFDMYSYPVPLNIDTRNFGSDGTRFGGGSFASAVTDEGQAFHVQSGYQVQQYYVGNVDASFSASWSSSFKGEDDYDEKWKTIRKAYILLENIDKVPDATYSQKERIKGEAKLMIALVYFEMFKRYGGVPLITKSFTGKETGEEAKMKRATLQETYQFILDKLDDVITNYEGLIPATYATVLKQDYGRFPMTLAYALKARLMLYAASPLYNTDQPYSSELGENSNLICFMNKDQERWRLAYEAADAAIKYCEANGYKLVNKEDGKENGANYTMANMGFPSQGNTEVIWSVLLPSSSNMQYFTLVRGLTTGGVQGYACNLVPLNQVERYELAGRSGEYRDWSNGFEYLTGIEETDSPEEAKKKLAAAARRPYEGLDPRFHRSITYNGVADYGDWGLNGDIDMADAVLDDGTLLDSQHGVLSEARQRTTVLHYVRKFSFGYEGKESTIKPQNIYMRLAELYLIRAEALNELGTAPAGVRADLNIIRERSGMPAVKVTDDQDELRDLIFHERNIELYYEDHRWFDLRRTLQSEKYIPVQIYKVQIRKWFHSAEDKYPYKITYKKVPYQKRYWSNHWYMNPFPKLEVQKQYGLIQNPGW